jgi:hypothetical protein
VFKGGGLLGCKGNEKVPVAGSAGNGLEGGGPRTENDDGDNLGGSGANGAPVDRGGLTPKEKVEAGGPDLTAVPSWGPLIDELGFDPNEKGNAGGPVPSGEDVVPPGAAPSVNDGTDRVGFATAANGGIGGLAAGKAAEAKLVKAEVATGFPVASLESSPGRMTCPVARGELRAGLVVIFPKSVGFSGGASKAKGFDESLGTGEPGGVVLDERDPADGVVKENELGVAEADDFKNGGDRSLGAMSVISLLLPARDETGEGTACGSPVFLPSTVLSSSASPSSSSSSCSCPCSSLLSSESSPSPSSASSSLSSGGGVNERPSSSSPEYSPES